jgi:hypothetical protein
MQKRRKNRSKQKQPGHTLNKALPEPPKHEAPQSTLSSDVGDTPLSDKHPDVEKLADGSGGFPSVRPRQESSGLSRETLQTGVAEPKGTYRDAP